MPRHDLGWKKKKWQVWVTCRDMRAQCRCPEPELTQRASSQGRFRFGVVIKRKYSSMRSSWSGPHKAPSTARG